MPRGASERVSRDLFAPVADELATLHVNAQAAAADPRIEDLLLLAQEARAVTARLERLLQGALDGMEERHLRLVTRA